MSSVLLIPTFAPGRREQAMRVLADAIAGLPGLQSHLLAPTLPGVYHGGDAICRLTFANTEAADAALASPAWAAAAALLADRQAVTQLDHAAYDRGRHGGDGPPGLYRVALFCADVRPDAGRLASFADETAALATSISAIGRWQLSTAREAGGLRRWTHVWEQEYRNLDGLLGPYMRHPAHWARAERWFDPEYPEHLVDPMLVHTFCAIDQPVLVGPE